MGMDWPSSGIITSVVERVEARTPFAEHSRRALEELAYNGHANRGQVRRDPLSFGAAIGGRAHLSRLSRLTALPLILEGSGKKEAGQSEEMACRAATLADWDWQATKGDGLPHLYNRRGSGWT
jgi:hypothetical protein